MSTSPLNKYEVIHFPYPHQTRFRSYIRKDGYKSDTRPVLPYSGCTSRAISFYGNQRVSAGQSGGSSYYFHTLGGVRSQDRPAVNRAYDKLREAAIGETSSLGAFVGEWRQSLGLIGQGVKAASFAVSTFRKGVIGVLRDFDKWKRRFKGRRLSSKIRQLVRRLSQGWLNFWYGWKPAVNDIYSGIQTIEKPLPYGQRHWGSSGNTSTVSFTYNGSALYSKGSQMSWNFRCKQGATFDLVNPNVALAAQLGLINPVSIAWELVPFSFLIDWVSGVGSWLSSFTDFAGVNVRQAYTTFYSHSIDIYKYDYPPVLSSKTGTVIEGFDQIRVSGLTRPLPNLQFFANLGASTTRAASAASLLSGKLYHLWDLLVMAKRNRLT